MIGPNLVQLIELHAAPFVAPWQSTYNYIVSQARRFIPEVWLPRDYNPFISCDTEINMEIELTQCTPNTLVVLAILSWITFSLARVSYLW